MLHDYLSIAKSSNLHYFVLFIGTVRGKPKTASGRPRKSHASSDHHSFNYYTLSILNLVIFAKGRLVVKSQI